MRSEGFPFIVWGSGVRFVCCVSARSSRVASRRVVARCVVNSVPCGSAFRARGACAVCGAVPWGLLLGRSCGCRCAVGICVSCASRVWRCAMGIAAGRVGWVPLCHADCWWACRVGGAVPWGLLVAWVALCHGDCCSAYRVGGAVPCFAIAVDLGHLGFT